MSNEQHFTVAPNFGSFLYADSGNSVHPKTAELLKVEGQIAELFVDSSFVERERESELCRRRLPLQQDRQGGGLSIQQRTQV